MLSDNSGSAKNSEVEADNSGNVKNSEVVADNSGNVKNSEVVADNSGSLKKMRILAGVLGAATIGLLISTIVLAVDDNGSSTTTMAATTPPPVGANPCEGKNPNASDVDCVIAGEQSGTDVTKGYVGSRNTTAVPITVPFYQMGMCPVNVHWHLGSEHYSVGQYDETGTGPSDINERRRLAGEEGLGYQCKYYDKNDATFTKEFKWQHCKDMEVGQTYEVHWPHSAAGACGTLNQYQTPFLDGVYCIDDVINSTAQQIGVQAQVFTIVNNESYYYPDLMRGMIVDGDMGADVAKYTGSTTGTAFDNEICSPYSPITWQVDRKCHLISASTFDKMCADMKAQRDDMSDDLHPHGSRELVSDENAAINHQGLRG